MLREGSLLLDSESQKDPTFSASGLDLSDFKHRRSSSKWNEELSPASSAITESTQASELISGSKLPAVCFTHSIPFITTPFSQTIFLFIYVSY